MTFWSGEKLADRLPREKIVEPFHESQLDCASYRLSVGTEAFVTADKNVPQRRVGRLVDYLGDAPDHTVTIEPGQFAFLLTYENVRVPNNAIALISMRVKYKFRGLINVSGFHVDPGWDGKLIFSVYNAGPRPVVIERLEPMFLIVFADLDQVTEKTYRGGSQHQRSIKPELLEGMLSQVFSPLMLQRRMEQLEEDALKVKVLSYGMTVVAGVLVAVATLWATYSPNSLGLIFGKMIEAGGYDIKLKASDPPKNASR